jgi:outer membrane protein
MKLTRSLVVPALAGLLALAPGAGRAQTATPSVYVNAPVTSDPVRRRPRMAVAACSRPAPAPRSVWARAISIRLSALGVLPEDRDSKLWINGNAVAGR